MQAVHVGLLSPPIAKPRLSIHSTPVSAPRPLYNERCAEQRWNAVTESRPLTLCLLFGSLVRLFRQDLSKSRLVYCKNFV